MAATSSQRLLSGLGGSSCAVGRKTTEARHCPLSGQAGIPCGFGSTKGLGSWKATRRRAAGVRCSAGDFKGLAKLPPMGSLLGDLRENNKDVKWALDYWDRELEDGYRSLDEWKAQLSNFRQENPTAKWAFDYWDRELEDGYKSLDDWGAQLSSLREGNPTVKWALDYWDRELEDGYKSLDDWGAQLADIQAGTWLSKLRADNPDVKWALDYWDQELLDGYKSLDEWKLQAGSIGQFFSENPVYLGAAVAVAFVPVLVFLSLRKGYAGDLAAGQAFARLNKEESSVLVDIRADSEIAKSGGPKLERRKRVRVACEKRGDNESGLVSEEKLLGKIKKDVSSKSTLIVVLDRAGSSAAQAAKALTKEGYKQVYIVRGGAEGPGGWRESQLPWDDAGRTSLFEVGGALSEAVGNVVQELQNNKQLPLAALGMAAAATTSLFLFSEGELVLQLLGSAAAVQLFMKKILFAADREETLRQVKTFLDTKVAPQELIDDLKELSSSLVTKDKALAEPEVAKSVSISSQEKLALFVKEGAPTSLEADKKGAPETKKGAASSSENNSREACAEEVIPDASAEEPLSAEAGSVLDYETTAKREAASSSEYDSTAASAEDTIPDANAEEPLSAEAGAVLDYETTAKVERKGASLQGSAGLEARPEGVPGPMEAEIPEANVENVLADMPASKKEAEAPKVAAETAVEERVEERIEEVSEVANDIEEKIKEADEELETLEEVTASRRLRLTRMVTEVTANQDEDEASEGRSRNLMVTLKALVGEGVRVAQAVVSGSVVEADSTADTVRAGIEKIAGQTASSVEEDTPPEKAKDFIAKGVEVAQAGVSGSVVEAESTADSVKAGIEKTAGQTTSPVEEDTPQEKATDFIANGAKVAEAAVSGSVVEAESTADTIKAGVEKSAGQTASPVEEDTPQEKARDFIAKGVKVAQAGVSGSVVEAESTVDTVKAGIEQTAGQTASPVEEDTPQEKATDFIANGAKVAQAAMSGSVVEAESTADSVKAGIEKTAGQTMSPVEEDTPQENAKHFIGKLVKVAQAAVSGSVVEAESTADSVKAGIEKSAGQTASHEEEDIPPEKAKGFIAQGVKDAQAALSGSVVEAESTADTVKAGIEESAGQTGSSSEAAKAEEDTPQQKARNILGKLAQVAQAALAGSVVEAEATADTVKAGIDKVAAQTPSSSEAEEDAPQEEATSSDTSPFGQVSEIEEPVEESRNKVVEVVSKPAKKSAQAVSDTAQSVTEAVAERVSEPAETVMEAFSGPAMAVEKATGGAVERIQAPVSGLEEAVDSKKEEAEDQIQETLAEQQDAEHGESPKEDSTRTEEATRAMKEALGPDMQEAPTEAGVITLLYESGWKQAYLHFSADGGSWTELPGVAFDFDDEQQLKIIRVPASSLQFVVTDGAGDWDTPPYGGNYSISASGTFRLSYGTISAVSKVEMQ